MEYEIERNEDPSYAVLRAVSVFENRPISKLPPLQETVDVDSLNRIFRSQSGGEALLSFDYSRSRVTVTGAGRVTVSKQTERMIVE